MVETWDVMLVWLSVSGSSLPAWKPLPGSSPQELPNSTSGAKRTGGTTMEKKSQKPGHDRPRMDNGTGRGRNKAEKEPPDPGHGGQRVGNARKKAEPPDPGADAPGTGGGEMETDVVAVIPPTQRHESPPDPGGGGATDSLRPTKRLALQ